MQPPSTSPDNWTTRVSKSTLRFIAWTFVWTASMVLADKAELYQWYDSAALSLLAIGLNALLGVGMIFSFIRHLNQMDELQRKIQLDALAMTVGISLVGCFSYSLLVTAGFITDVEVSDIILLMTFSYMAGVGVGQVRYR